MKKKFPRLISIILGAIFCLSFTSCDGDDIEKLTDISRYSTMTPEGTEEIEVEFDNNTGTLFYFTIEDEETICEIMDIVINAGVDAKDEDLWDGDNTYINIVQGNNEYRLSVRANKEKDTFYYFDEPDLQNKIIELAREAGAYEPENPFTDFSAFANVVINGLGNKGYTSTKDFSSVTFTKGENTSTVSADFYDENTISLTQRLFELRLDLLQELQKIEHQEIEFNKQFYLKLKGQLYNVVKIIKGNSARISVRQKMSFIDKYADEKTWEYISPLAGKEIKLHIAPLADEDIMGHQFSKSFDAKMFNIELNYLVTGEAISAKKDIAVVRLTAKYLLTKASIPEIMAKADALKTAESENFWINADLKSIELLREEIRDLMKYIEGEGDVPPVITHFDDEEEEVESSGAGMLDIRTYREKVLDYLANNFDNPVIRKIKNLEQLTSEDLEELEKILWEQLGSKTDYYKTTSADNLAVFIRSLVGLDQQAINEKFGEFLNENVLNSQQQEFLQTIINYVKENGDIESEDLLNVSPFDNYDILELFGEKIKVLQYVINTVHGVVQAAA